MVGRRRKTGIQAQLQKRPATHVERKRHDVCRSGTMAMPYECVYRPGPAACADSASPEVVDGGQRVQRTRVKVDEVAVQRLALTHGRQIGETTTREGGSHGGAERKEKYNRVDGGSEAEIHDCFSIDVEINNNTQKASGDIDGGQEKDQHTKYGCRHDGTGWMHAGQCL